MLNLSSRAGLFAGAVLFWATGCAAVGQPAAAPRLVEDEGRFDRLSALFDAYVEDGLLPGGVVQVTQGDEVIFAEAFGWRDIDENEPMTADTIFRIASQTKAIVSVAALMLQEEGALLIDDPLSRYLPEWESVSVAQPDGDGGYQRVPATRPITVRDLLTHTSGVGYGGRFGASAPGGEEWSRAGFQDWYLADKDQPIRELAAAMAELPLREHPGHAWVYGYNTDILGAVVEVASGLPLDEFLRQRIFAPLGMIDTHFYLPAEKTDRLATVYSLNGGDLAEAPEPGAAVGQGAYVEGPRAVFSGGAGLLSTAHDYSRFLQMLENGGELDGARILSRKSVELMTQDHLPRDVRFNPGVGFGLGVSVVEDVGQRGLMGSEGEYGWGGAYHSTYWVDPAEELTVVYMTQVIPANGLDDHAKLRTLLYSVLD